MALFDEILAKVNAEDKAVLEKYPDIAATVTALEKEYQEANAALTQWEEWRANNWDDEAKTTKAHVMDYQKLVAAEQRIRQLEAAGETGMTWEQIKEQAQKEGVFLTKEQAEAVARARLEEFVEKVHKPALNNVVGAVETIFAGIYPLGFKHQQEFGEVLDPSAVLKYMNEHKIYQPEKAYEEMVSARRAEKAAEAQKELEKKHQEELEAARREEREKVRQEMAMAATSSPTDLGGVTRAMGHLERARMAEGAKDKETPAGPPPDAKLGDGVIAQLGYRKFLSKQNPGEAVQ